MFTTPVARLPRWPTPSSPLLNHHGCDLASPVVNDAGSPFAATGETPSMACPGRYTKSVHQLHRTSDSERSGVPSPGFLTPHTRPHACHTGFGRRCNKTHSSLLPFLYLFLLLSPPHKFCIEKPQFMRLVHAKTFCPQAPSASRQEWSWGDSIEA